MALLRMLAFRVDAGGARPGTESRPAAPSGTREHGPTAPGHHAAPKPAAGERPAVPARERNAPPAPAEPAINREPLALGSDGMPDWEQWIMRANLGGPVGQLARHAAPKSLEGAMLTLAIKPEHQPMADSLGEELQRQLGEALGKPLRLRFVSDTAVETPAARAARAQSAEQAAAAQAIEADPFVRQLQSEFGARVIPESIRPLNTK
jgi:DNA polymerase-3 subunit gamma/tau